ncbi:MAG: hypothetical protein K2R98_08460 [Gemmataceae bacterium]|nr:hypothetical protein [Gemmataceae bacterium]
MYSPTDHYWDNGADVFSSARQARVPYSDPAYTAWLAAGNTATRDPGNADLRDLLSPYGVGLSPAETAKLATINAFVQRPDLVVRLLARLLRRLRANGTITAGQLADLLATDAQSDPSA